MDKTIVKKVGLASIGFLIFVACMAFSLKHIEQKVSPVVAQSGDKIIYLTFDDGPSKNTEEILNILDEYEVKATFFVTGISEEHSAMIGEEAKRGHAVGIHTYSHEYKTIYESVDAYFKDFNKTSDLIKAQTGNTTKIMRFPGGTSNTISKKYSSGIMSELAKQVAEQGYAYYDWNAENGDGNSHLSADTLVRTALASVKGKDTVMMLMHDGGGNKATVKALPVILKSLKEQGFQFRIIDEDTPVFHHHIAN